MKYKSLKYRVPRVANIMRNGTDWPPVRQGIGTELITQGSTARANVEQVIADRMQAEVAQVEANRKSNAVLATIDANRAYINSLPFGVREVANVLTSPLSLGANMLTDLYGDRYTLPGNRYWATNLGEDLANTAAFTMLGASSGLAEVGTMRNVAANLLDEATLGVRSLPSLAKGVYQSARALPKFVKSKLGSTAETASDFVGPANVEFDAGTGRATIDGATQRGDVSPAIADFNASLPQLNANISAQNARVLPDEINLPEGITTGERPRVTTDEIIRLPSDLDQALQKLAPERGGFISERSLARAIEDSEEALVRRFLGPDAESYPHSTNYAVRDLYSQGLTTPEIATYTRTGVLPADIEPFRVAPQTAHSLVDNIQRVRNIVEGTGVPFSRVLSFHRRRLGDLFSVSSPAEVEGYVNTLEDRISQLPENPAGYELNNAFREAVELFGVDLSSLRTAALDRRRDAIRNFSYVESPRTPRPVTPTPTPTPSSPTGTVDPTLPPPPIEIDAVGLNPRSLEEKAEELLRTTTVTPSVDDVPAVDPELLRKKLIEDIKSIKDFKVNTAEGKKVLDDDQEGFRYGLRGFVDDVVMGATDLNSDVGKATVKRLRDSGLSDAQISDYLSTGKVPSGNYDIPELEYATDLTHKSLNNAKAILKANGIKVEDVPKKLLRNLVRGSREVTPKRTERIIERALESGVIKEPIKDLELEYQPGEGLPRLNRLHGTEESLVNRPNSGRGQVRRHSYLNEEGSKVTRAGNVEMVDDGRRIKVNDLDGGGYLDVVRNPKDYGNPSAGYEYSVNSYMGNSARTAAGKAYDMVRSLMKKGDVLQETGSLSLDSFPVMMSRAKNKDIKATVGGYVHLNNMAKHRSFPAETNARGNNFHSKGDAEKGAAYLNKMLDKYNIKERVKIKAVNNMDDSGNEILEYYEIYVPTLKFEKIEETEIGGQLFAYGGNARVPLLVELNKKRRR